MAVGIDASLGEILHGVVHLTGRERPGLGTIRVPRKKKRISSSNHRQDGMDVDDLPGSGDDSEDETETIGDDRDGEATLPIPSLSTLQSVFTISPGVYPQISPAIYKLKTGLTMVEAELNKPVKPDIKPSFSVSPQRKPIPPASVNGNGTSNGHAEKSPAQTSTPLPTETGVVISTPTKTTVQLPPTPISHVHSQANGIGETSGDRSDVITQTLLSSGLLKLDKAGRQSEAGDEGVGTGTKKGKHNLHWKYEDPAIILKDVLD